MHHPDIPASSHVLTKVGFTRNGTSDRDTEGGTAAYKLYALEVRGTAGSHRAGCRTAGGSPTNEHRTRRDAVGPIPYAKGRQEGLIP